MVKKIKTVFWIIVVIAAVPVILLPFELKFGDKASYWPKFDGTTFATVYSAGNSGMKYMSNFPTYWNMELPTFYSTEAHNSQYRCATQGQKISINRDWLFALGSDLGIASIGVRDAETRELFVRFNVSGGERSFGMASDAGFTKIIGTNPGIQRPIKAGSEKFFCLDLRAEKESTSEGKNITNFWCAASFNVITRELRLLDIEEASTAKWPRNASLRSGICNELK